MKQFWMNKKFLIGMIGAAIVAAGVIVGVLFLSGQEESYRTIQIYQLDGTAEVTRQPQQVIEPYENMMLQNQDGVRIFEKSYLYMKLDEDKYVLGEPLTEFTLEAAGTSQDSKTRIELKKAAVVSHITESLGEDSSYRVDTPNSTMAVRGTSFRVYVWYDKDGESHSLLQVYEGTVEVHLVYPDGSISEESRLIQAGETVYVWGSNETSNYESANEEVNYYKLDIPTLEFLKIGIKDIKNFPMKIRDVDEIIRLKQTYFDVIFMNGQKEFGRQSVLFDHYATDPSLTPTPKGRWNFNFRTAIRERTEIKWIEE